MDPICFVTFYRFMPLPQFEELQEPIRSALADLSVTGTVLLAKEGVNSTICATRSQLERALAFLDSRLPFPIENAKFSYADSTLVPFKKLKVKLKKEIVTMGVEQVDPTKNVGVYVKPQDWNALISDPDTLVLDTRNSYEVAIGTFERAVDPEIESFREFPEKSLALLEKSGKKRVAMFCTGGIRCEKASSFLVQNGIPTFHLEGGILKYLEEVDPSETRWKGECFVFDERVSVDHALKPGGYRLCRGCRNPISDEDLRSNLFEEGVSCPSCFHQTSTQDKQRFRDRQKHFDRQRLRKFTSFAF